MPIPLKLSLSQTKRFLSMPTRNVVLTDQQVEEIQEQLASIPLDEDEERLLLPTGKYIGEAFDDARLDTLFLAPPVSWKGTLVQYVGRLH
jgi:superfamily II DNA or RNA helicase